MNYDSFFMMFGPLFEVLFILFYNFIELQK